LDGHFPQKKNQSSSGQLEEQEQQEHREVSVFDAV
jgi:hypothetical protein